jgi:thiol-disulfide isomerase/thioredoxin
MKRFVFIVAAWFLCQQSFAQIAGVDSLPTYKKYPDVPLFSIIKVPDSTTFTKADLVKNKPLVLIMFSPDCEHCQREMDSLEKHFDLFKKAQIVMATPLDYFHVKDFYTKYKVADYPNITIGKDPVWYLGGFYNVRNFPTIVVYDKHGQFVKLFEGSVAVAKVAAAL